MLQIVTINLGGARKLRQPPISPRQTAIDTATTLKQVIDPTLPTIIGLQETHWLEWETQRQDLTATLAAELGCHNFAFAPEVTTDQHPHSKLWQKDCYAGIIDGAEGNGLLTNLAPAQWGYPTFQNRANWWTHAQIGRPALYSSGNRNTQPRNVMLASVNHPQYGDLFFLNTHLGSLTDENRHDEFDKRTQVAEQIRLEQVNHILQIVAELRELEQNNRSLPRPIILVGDFNAQKDWGCMAALSKTFDYLQSVTPTEQRYTHVTHQQEIDFIMVNDPAQILPKGFTQVLTHPLFDDLTDHQAVIANLDN